MLLSTVNWINPSGGDWDTAANWRDATTGTNHVPGAGDDAVINTAGITVTHSSAVADTVHSLSSQAALVLSGGSLSVAAASTVNNNLQLINGATLKGCLQMARIMRYEQM